MGQVELVMTVALALGGVLTGLMNLVKESDVFPSKYTPYVALAVGVVAGVIVAPLFGITLYLGALAGFVAGLSSVGYFELNKASKV